MQITTAPIALASQWHTARDPAFQLQLYTFDAYGNLLGWTNAQPLTSYLYSGESFDFSIGQQYLRARFYDATTGRFNRLDPFFGNSSDPQSFHKYGYVHGDPIHGVDPTGMFLAGSTLAGMSVGGYVAGLKSSVDMSILSAFQMLSESQTVGMTEQELLYQLFVINSIGFDPLAVANSLYTLLFDPPAIIEAEAGRITRRGYQNILSLMSQSVESIFEDGGAATGGHVGAMAARGTAVAFQTFTKPLRNAFAAFGNLSTKMRNRAFDALKNERFMKPATSLADTGQQVIHFASAKVTIDGMGSRKMHAFSGGIDMTQVFPNEGFVPNNRPAVLPFTGTRAGRSAGNVHSEWKILNDLAQSGITSSSKGKVTLYSELLPCGSCDSAIREFSRRFPRIKLSIIYVTPEAGYLRT